MSQKMYISPENKEYICLIVQLNRGEGTESSSLMNLHDNSALTLIKSAQKVGKSMLFFASHVYLLSESYLRIIVPPLRAISYLT